MARVSDTEALVKKGLTSGEYKAAYCQPKKPVGTTSELKSAEAYLTRVDQVIVK